MVSYLVTTDLDRLPKDKQIVMVDGTVPGFIPRPEDLHFDHHSPDGSDIQIADIPWYVVKEVKSDAVIVTPMLDADAIVAALWVQIADKLETDIIRILWAIAWDCDHLGVPPELIDLEELASNVVATLKFESESLYEELGLTPTRKGWSSLDKERFASLAFERGVERLKASCDGSLRWPGTNGEAETYWKRVEENSMILEKQNRVFCYRGAVIADLRNIHLGQFDPRSVIQVIDRKLKPRLPITLTQRDIFSKNKETGEMEFKGWSYVLGYNREHPLADSLNYVQRTFAALTEIEKQKNPNLEESWSGRRHVGGNGRNSASQLTPQEVLDIAIETSCWIDSNEVGSWE